MSGCADIKRSLSRKCAAMGIPVSGIFELTPRCNLRCRMCYVRLTPEEMAPLGQEQTTGQWLELARQYDMPIVPMNHFKDVTQDPQAWANDYLEHVEFPSGNVDVMPRSPIEMDSVGQIITKPAPKVGADTKDVLLSLGYTDEQIAAFEESGAVFTGK